MCKIKLPETGERYLTYCKGVKSASENTIDGYRTDLSIFFQWLIEYKNVEQISINDINKISLGDLDVFMEYLDIRNQNLNGKDAAKTTKRRRVATIKGFFNYLHDRDLINNNPTEKLKSPRKEKTKHIALKANFINDRLEHVEDFRRHSLRDTAICVLLINTGLRVSEMCALNRIQVEQKRLIVNGKGDKDRVIKIGCNTYEAIKRYLDTREDNNESLFLNERGQRISRQAVALITQSMFGCSPHALRHMCATMKLKQGYSIKAVQKLLGHSDASTTMLYLDDIEGEVEEAFEDEII